MRRAAATALAALLTAAVARQIRAADTIILVTTTADIGGSCPGANCTLRAAIAYANASPTLEQIIGFNISGACPQTINLFSELPTVGDSLSIRGYTQPGAQPNDSDVADNATLCIQIKPASSGSNIVNGLRFAPSDTTSTFDVSGLAIGGFDRGIRIEGGNYTIGGNFIGLDADGVTQRVNAYDGVAVYASNSYFAATRRIGGNAAAQRNVISGNGTGVTLASGGGNLVRGNFIGTTRSGNSALANINGIYASSIGNDVQDNVISGNSGAAIRIEGANGLANSVGGNRIGLKAFAFCVPQPCTPNDALGNGGDGVRIANTAVGNNISGNAIAWNGGDGISLPDAGPQNFISANSMHDNDGLGIDLGADSVNANDNDATAPAGSPNRLLNFPVVTLAGGNALAGTARGYLQSTNGHYTIEFYADDTPDPGLHGEGRTYLGSGELDITDAPAGQNGSSAFAIPINYTNSLVGESISAFARDGVGNTSEFSLRTVYAFQDAIFANDFEPFAE